MKDETVYSPLSLDATQRIEAERDAAITERDQLRAHLEQRTAALRSLCESAVGFDDPRLDYVEVQIDRGDWLAARALADLPDAHVKEP